eukprot:g13071.t1
MDVGGCMTLFPTSEQAAKTFQQRLLVTNEKLRLDTQRSRAFVAIEDSVQKTLNQRSAQLKACKQEGEAIAIALVFVWHGIKCGFSSLSGLEQFEPKLPSGARNGY